MAFEVVSPLVPTLMIFLTGSSRRWVLVVDPVTFEFSMVWVVVTLSLPGLPSWTVSWVPAGIESSNWISVSNGTATSDSMTFSPVVLVPTRMICSVGSLVRSVVTVGSPEGLPSTSF
ncbi:Uncharacterised protein [Mycobacteroides abscessus subsp. abscessus]|nr:Uncharacterised protein [Mycobacteroides abscessus subsp. abscessus]